MAGVPAGRLSIEIVAEIARLQDGLDKAKRAVNAASKDIAASAKGANDNLAGLGGGLNKAASTGKLAGHQIQNLAFQFQDLGIQMVGAAQSSHPLKLAMTALMQQGSQISGIMGQAGIGVKGLAAEVGGMVTRFAAAHPVLAGIAIAAAAAAAALGVFAHEINSERQGELDAYTKSLGLTNEELEKMGPLTVTAGDVIAVLWSRIKEGLELDKVFAMIRWIAETAFDAIYKAGKFSIASIYAAFVGGAAGIKAVWNDIPAAIGDAAVSAANVAIKAINWLLSKAATVFNQWLVGINGMLDLLGMSKIADFKAPQLEQLTNPFAGAGQKAGNEFVGAVKAAFNYANSGIDGAVKRFADDTVKHAQARFKQQAEDKGFLDPEDAKASGAKAGKAAGDAFVKAFAEALDQVEDALRAIEAAAGDGFGNLAGGFGDLIGDMIDEVGKLGKEIEDQLLNRMNALNSGLGSGSLGSLIGALTSKDPTAGLLGMGGIGTLIGLSTRGGQEAYTKQRQAIEDGLTAVFGKNASGFAGTLAGVLQGASTGSLVGGVLGGGKGGQIGSQLGGAAGQALATVMGAAGPIGAIAGAILGNVLGSALKSTKTGRATFADGGVSTSGNSQSRIGTASNLAGSVMQALQQIADAFGATLGTFNGTIGVRNNSIRYNANGTSLKQGQNFGQDEEAALKAAIADAISDGVFGGLSEGVQRLLSGEGDVEARLQKALSLTSAMNELQATKDPQASALGDLDKQFDNLRAIATEAGEGLAQIEELYGLKRKEIVDKYEQEAIDKLRPVQELQLQIYQAEGDIDKARGLQHEMQLQGLDDVQRAMTIRLFQLESEADLAAKQKAIADERYGLETQLYQVMGDNAKLQERQLATISEANRPLQEYIWAMQAQQQAADDAARAVEEAAQAQQRIDDERQGIERQIMQLLGDTNGLRQDELAGLDEANRARMEYLYGLQDEIAAQQEAAAKLKAISDERDGLTTSWLQLIGDEATLRARALAQLDPSNRALQQQIYDEQDRQKLLADQAAAQQELARQTEAANAAIAEMAGRFTDYAKTIREFQAGLFADQNGGTYATTLADFKRTSSMASLGDEASLQSFVGVSQKFLESARNNAGSYADYRRAIGMVSAAADQAASGADKMAQMAAQQLAYVQTTAVQAQAISETSLDTLAELQAQTKTEESDVIPTLRSMAATMDEMRDEIARLREEARISAAASVSAANRTANTLGSWDAGDHARISNDSDTPVTVTGNITVINPADTPVNVDQVA